MVTEPTSSLYVHVPFCARKCSYCAFYSEASQAELRERYVAALARELAGMPCEGRPQTVFFGGGTPSLLTRRQWEPILDALHRSGWTGAREWTVESNPSTISLETARFLRAHGVNRLSIGIQSLDDALLRRLGRVHSRKAALEAYGIARQAGFDNVNLDLMFAIPGQTMESWQRTLAEVIALQPDHLSSYEVIYEEDTPLYEQLRARKFDVDEDLACAMYQELVERCAAAGFHRYEVANFARDDSPATAAGRLPSRACLHNVNYWRGGAFYGAGPSAAGYVGGVRMKNIADTRRYCTALETGQSPLESTEELAPLARAGEIAAFGLRMPLGWDFTEFERRTGHDLREHWDGEMRQLVDQGWGERSATCFRLTSGGLRFADAAALLFLR